MHRQATVWLGKYDSLKPRATLSRTLSDDPEADRDDMERILYVELRVATLRELQGRDELEELLGKNLNLTRLIEHCEQVIAHGPDGSEATEALIWPAPEASQQSSPRRKAKRRKAKRRSSRE